MCPKSADGMANSVDPDQTSPVSGSTLFTQTCLSENLGTLRYAFWWLVVLVFYGPSTHFRSFRARSVNLATLFLGKSPRQFVSTST